MWAAVIVVAASAAWPIYIIITFGWIPWPEIAIAFTPTAMNVAVCAPLVWGLRRRIRTWVIIGYLLASLVLINGFASAASMLNVPKELPGRNLLLVLAATLVTAGSVAVLSLVRGGLPEKRSARADRRPNRSKPVPARDNVVESDPW